MTSGLRKTNLYSAGHRSGLADIVTLGASAHNAPHRPSDGDEMS